ncbi:BZ3501_MvSof-1269-A2-R1_Chr9g10218 [Microbotryum saponariae]|nr:BZ3501_MvSof-1269-A2-R1_Chr9g10218 [Microbotryum saponariae]
MGQDGEADRERSRVSNSVADSGAKGRETFLSRGSSPNAPRHSLDLNNAPLILTPIRVHQTISSSTTITLTTPATALPNDPSSLAKLIRQRHLVALQALYEQRTLQHIAQQERLALQRRQKRLAALGAEEGTTTTTTTTTTSSSEVEMTEEVEEDPKVAEASDRQTVYKALYLSEPTSSTASTTAASTAPSSSSSSSSSSYSSSSASLPPPPIDRLGHAYDFVYHLAPNGSSDAYYHGPHPPPPSKIVNSIIKAYKNPPFFDPTGLTSNQLLPKATELFQAPFRNTASSSSTTTPSTTTLTTTPASAVPPTETIDVVEAELIASFSASCDERIGETLAKMEQPDREVALQRRDDARYAIGVANAAQLQQLQQHRSGAQMQVGSSGGVQGSVVGPQGAGGYGAWR